MRMKLKLGSAVAITALTLAGCSPGDTAPKEPDGSEEVTLRIATSTIVEKAEGAIEQAYADAYMTEHPNVKIEFIGVPSNELQAKLVTMATGGDMPDIFFTFAEFVPQAHEMGLAADLEPLLGEDFIKGFHPTAVKQSTIDGVMEMAPWFVIPTGMLYRTDWFEEAGLEPPETIDDFVAAAQALTQDTDNDGNVDRWGVALLGSADNSGGGRFVPLMRSMGAAELFQDNAGKWDTGYDSEEGVAAFQLYGDLVNKYQVVPPGVLSTSYAEAVSLIASEKAGMMITGSNGIGAVLAENPDLDGKLASIPLPHATGSTPAASAGFCGYSISESSEVKDIAADYLKFILSKENQVEWTTATGRLPSRLDAQADPAVNAPALQGWIKAIDYAYDLPAVPYYETVLLASAEAYQSVILGQATAQEAADRAAAAVREEIKNAQ